MVEFYNGVPIFGFALFLTLIYSLKIAHICMLHFDHIHPLIPAFNPTTEPQPIFLQNVYSPSIIIYLFRLLAY